MALSPLYYPYDYHSAYRPVIYRVVSDSYRPPNLFFSDGLIQAVRLPTDTEVSTYGVDPSSVILEHTLPTAALAGQLYRLGDTLAQDDLSGTSRYPGIYRVERVLTSTTMVINASYIGQPTSGGWVQLVPGNFTIFAKVTGPNITTPVEYSLKPVLDPNAYGPGAAAYVFELDCRDALARHFKDIKEIAQTGTNAITNAEGYITMKYDVLFYEAYDVVDPSGNGSVTFTRFDNVQQLRFEIFGQTCVNAVHPYHKVERNGDITLDWADSFNESYVMSSVGVGTSRRFLTYMDRDKTTIRRGDSFFLSWMWQGAPLNTKMRVRFVDLSGTILGTADIGNDTNANLGATSYICNIGSAIDNGPSNAATMQAYLIRPSNQQRLSEIFTFKVEECKGVNKRWYYLNKLGGVDAFTFSGDETREMSVSRDLISKPNMAIPELVMMSGGTFRGDFQRRVWRTQPDRRYTLTSGYMLPLQLRVIAEEMFESPNIFTEQREGWWTNIIPMTTEVPGDSNSGRAERFVIQYRLGVDNVTQRT